VAIIGTQLGWGQVELGNSESEFSGVQGQADWSYGYRNYTADGGAENYDSANDFIVFGSAQFDGTNWDLGAGAPWTTVGATQVHPNGTNNIDEHWAIRRWTATAADVPAASLVAVEWRVAAQNLNGGSGTSGRLHLNGELKKEVSVGGADGTGVTTITFLTVSDGDVLDLALTPVGPSGDRSDGSDGSVSRMVISTVVDSDNDLLADSWEESFFPGDLSQLSSGDDFDNDNLTDGEEFELDTNPTLADSDADGLNDEFETDDGIFVSATETGTNPTLADSDGDGLSDGEEVNGTPATNPNQADSDGDGVNDSDELNIYGSDPNDINDLPLSKALGDSRSEFSGVDGQNSWRWGYRNFTADGGTTAYDAVADFIPFPVNGTNALSSVNFWNGNAYDWADDAGPVNPPWTQLANENSHPNGTNNGEEHWTIRRWTASGLGASTPVRVIWHTRKGNVDNDGVTGAIHQNGVQLDSQTIAGSNTTGFVRYHYVNLKDGDIIDLVLTPEGVTNRTDGSDGSANWMTVDTRVPLLAIHSNGKYFIPDGSADTDADGMADFWEEVYFLGDLTKLFAGGDSDGDGLIDEDEMGHGTNPTKADSDDDGVDDADEIALGSNPCEPDLDHDGDGFSTELELATGHNPADANSNVVSSPGLEADSLTNYPQGEVDPQGVNGWTYGYYNTSLNGEPTSSTSFIQFPTDGSIIYSPTNFWDGNKFDMIDGGGAPSNPPWTEISPTTAHPNGDNNGEVHWVTMRWQAASNGPLSVTYDLRKVGMGGNGTTAVLLQNGSPLDEITVGGTDGVGQRSWYFINAQAGDTIELALSPKGLDELFTDGNDNSSMKMWIDTVLPANPTQPDGMPFVPIAALDALRILTANYDKGTGALTVKFTSRDGFEYQIEKLTGTDPVSWTPIGPSASPQEGGETEVVIPGVTDDRAIIHVIELVP